MFCCGVGLLTTTAELVEEREGEALADVCVGERVELCVRVGAVFVVVVQTLSTGRPRLAKILLAIIREKLPSTAAALEVSEDKGI